LSIADNLDLEEMIDQYKDQCDEEDEVEFNDEDYPLLDLMEDGDWTVEWYSDTTDETSSFDGYLFSFRSDLVLRVNTGTAIIEGAWEPDAQSGNLFIEMDFETDEAPLEWLKDEWTVISLNSSRIELESESDVDGYIRTLYLVRSE
jgi:hypothetical protein